MDIMVRIGDRVVKYSNRPFKSGLMTETVNGFGKNPQDPKNRDCVVFEDGSCCNLDLVYTVK
jgi:hypothetical protein